MGFQNELAGRLYNTVLVFEGDSTGGGFLVSSTDDYPMSSGVQNHLLDSRIVPRNQENKWLLMS